jgi:HPt (histidine-containing phosphotransfer) domain-containing protein
MQPFFRDLDSKSLTDLESLKKKLKADEAFIDNILDVFLMDFPFHLKELELAVENQDQDKIRYYVHKLGSSLGMICKNEVGRFVENLEKQVERKGLSKKAKMSLKMSIEIGNKVLEEVTEYKETMVKM